MSRSRIEDLARAAGGVRALLASLTPAEAEAVLRDWTLWRRPEQTPPAGEWWCWVYMAGRGNGKTRGGAEWFVSRKRAGCRHMALVGRTEDDVRDVMACGPDGVIACCAPHEAPRYVPTRKSLLWPDGTYTRMFSGDAPNSLRGPQHDTVWCDEWCTWRYLDEAWDDGVSMGLRSTNGGRVIPQCLVTTTPRPIRKLRELIAEPGVSVTRGRTRDNRALPASYVARLEARYGGTPRGRQELDGEIIESTPGALWTADGLDATRRLTYPPLVRVAVGVDPARSSSSASDETGIVVVGLAADGHGYVLDDASGHHTPAEWAQAAAALALRYDAPVVVETNVGGELALAVLRAVAPACRTVGVTASEGKRARAEPLAALYAAGLVHHVGALAELEDQLCEWPSTGSPDRLDALVWGAQYALAPLLRGHSQAPVPRVPRRTAPRQARGPGRPRATLRGLR